MNKESVSYKLYYRREMRFITVGKCDREAILTGEYGRY